MGWQTLTVDELLALDEMTREERIEWHTRRIARLGLSRDKGYQPKMGAETCKAIRMACDAGTPIREVADRFKVSEGTVRKIRRGTTWRTAS